MASLLIRDARPEDSERAQKIVFSALREYGIEPEPDGLDADVMTFGKGTNLGAKELVVEEDGAVIGMATLTSRRSGIGYLSKLFVDRTRRKRGVGRALLLAAVDEARRSGFERVELQTRTIFKEAVRLYEMAGWKRGPDPGHGGPDRTYYLDLDTVDFYFDYISPFAFFGCHSIQKLLEKRALKVNLRPIVFGALLSHWGQRGPAEIPPKREFTFKQCLRYAALNGIALQGPKFHPFNPLTALRISIAEVAKERQAEVVGALFDAIWCEGIDGGDRSQIRDALIRRGIEADSLLSHADEGDVKALLRRDTDEAIARGVFGVPTFMVGQELFWGNDSLGAVQSALDGRDPLDRFRVAEWLSRARGADRKV